MSGRILFLSCRSRPCLLVAVAPLAGRWCFWRLRSWRWCFLLACVFFLWAPSKDRFSSTSIPSMFWDFGFLHQKHRVGGTHGHVRREGSVGWRSPVPRGGNTGGRGRVLPPPTITLQSRRQVLYFLMHLGVDGVRDGRMSTSRRVPFLGLVLGLRFSLPEASRRHLLRPVAAAVVSFPVVAGVTCHVLSRQACLFLPSTFSLSLQGEIAEEHCQVVSPISVVFDFRWKLTFKVALPPLCCRGNLHSFFMTLFTGRRASSFQLPWERGVGSVLSC